MAKLGISIKIDVTKIDKARLFKGNKGSVFRTCKVLSSPFSNGMITLRAECVPLLSHSLVQGRIGEKKPEGLQKIS